MIQGLRALAALTVMLCHVSADVTIANINPPHSQFLDYLIIGRHGVELFFMISGYLITQSLVRHANAADFMVDRALRIYPTYIPVLLIIFVGGPFIGYDYFEGSPPVEWPLHFSANVLFLPGVFPIRPALGVAWTLSWEAAFYIGSAVTWLIVARSRVAGALAGIGLAVIATLLFPRFAFFVVGILVYLFRDAIRARGAWLGALSLPSLVLFYVFCGWRRTYEDNGVIDASYVAILALCVVVGAMLFVSVALERGVVSKLLRSQAFQFLGAISFSFYLWHTLVMIPTKKLFLHHFAARLGDWPAVILFFVASMVLVTAVSWLSYRIIEKAASKWLASRLRSGPKTATAPALP